MGFDQNDDRPISNVHRRATRVSLWMVVGILGFLIAGGVLIWVLVTQEPGP